jgi:hypothetical protein
MTRQHPQTIAAARLLENLSVPVWEALAHLRDEMRAVDGYGAGGSSDGGSRGSSTTSTTERAAMTLDAFVDQNTEIKRTITDIVALIDSLGRLCQRVIGNQASQPPAVLCSSKGLTGAEEWGDPFCTNVPRAASGGLCHSCNMRSSRWRNAASLNPIRSNETDNLGSFHFDIVEGVASAWGQPLDAA